MTGALPLDILPWAKRYIESHNPDEIIGSVENPIMKVWYLIPDNSFCSLHIHQFLSSDTRPLHNHPFDNKSWLLEGSYWEDTPEKTYHRKPGDIVSRKAEERHRIILINEKPALGLFCMMEWGSLWI